MSTSSPDPADPSHQSDKSRWCAFVCQDCRAIFRVPADYEGSGVVCPSCDRMLRLPRAGDKIPALVQNEYPLSTEDFKKSKNEVSRIIPTRITDEDVEDTEHIPIAPMKTSFTKSVSRRSKKKREKSPDTETDW